MDAEVAKEVRIVRPQWKKDFQISNEKIRAFATSIEDFNPLHHDSAAAQAVGLHDIIAPGVMMNGYVSSGLAEEIPGVLLRKLEVDFLKPLYGTSLPNVTFVLVSQKRHVAKVQFTLWNWLEPIMEGHCILILPKTA